MNRNPMPATATLVLSICAACAAHAQTNPTAPPPVPTSPPPVDTAAPPVDSTPPPVGTPRTDVQPTNPAQQDVPRDANGNPLSTGTPSQSVTGAMRAAPQPLDFQMLDTERAGSLKLDQVRNDPWLRQHFRECDANHNDVVTEAEYAKCTGR